MTFPIRFVSLGPGDPELISLKALNALREADVVLLPATLRHDGSQASRAEDIVRALGVTTETRLYALPMRQQREEAQAVYARMEADATRLQHEGRRVVIGVGGDASIYASVHYILEHMAVNGVSTEQVAGIPSFIAAAAWAQLSLTSQDKRLLVVPGDVSEEEISQLLNANCVLVIMKLSQCEAAVKAFISTHPTNHEYHYFENVGTTQEYYSADSREIAERHFPYFSQLIIR